jgi:hypothetical protein
MRYVCIAWLLLLAGCPLSEADCGQCKPDEVCHLSYEYCNTAHPRALRCRPRPTACAVGDECVKDGGACALAVQSEYIMPIFKACHGGADSGIVASWCD